MRDNNDLGLYKQCKTKIANNFDSGKADGGRLVLNNPKKSLSVTPWQNTQNAKWQISTMALFCKKCYQSKTLDLLMLNSFDCDINICSVGRTVWLQSAKPYSVLDLSMHLSLIDELPNNGNKWQQLFYDDS